MTRWIIISKPKGMAVFCFPKTFSCERDAEEYNTHYGCVDNEIIKIEIKDEARRK